MLPSAASCLSFSVRLLLANRLIKIARILSVIRYSLQKMGYTKLYTKMHHFYPKNRNADAVLEMIESPSEGDLIKRIRLDTFVLPLISAMEIFKK